MHFHVLDEPARACPAFSPERGLCFAQKFFLETLTMSPMELQDMNEIKRIEKNVENFSQV